MSGSQAVHHRSDLVEIARRAMVERGLEPDFSSQAQGELDKIPGPPRSVPGLRNLRDLLWCSIDNDDSKDLDQPAGAIVLLLSQSHDGLSVEDRLGLERLQIESALLEPVRAELARHGVLYAKLLVHPGHAGDGVGRLLFPVEPGRDGVIGELGAVVNRGGIDVRASDRAVFADRDLDDDGQPVLSLVQRSQVR